MVTAPSMLVTKFTRTTGRLRGTEYASSSSSSERGARPPAGQTRTISEAWDSVMQTVSRGSYDTTTEFIEICQHYGLRRGESPPGRSMNTSPRSTSQVWGSTVFHCRQNTKLIDSYFAFLGQRYAGEIGHRRAAQ